MLSEIVGYVYIFLGFFGIFLNLLAAFLMFNNKTTNQNLTYLLMINLSIADAIVLLSIAFYAGLHCLLKIDIEIVDRIFGWIVAVGWYPGCMFFVGIAFARWVAITQPPRLHGRMRKRHILIFVLFCWFVSASFYSCMIFYPNTLFIWYNDYFSWGFDEESSFFGYYLQKQNTATNILFAVLQTLFNVKTIVWLRRTRNQALSISESKNRKREVKLFLQCLANGIAFVSAAVMYALFYAVSKYATSTHFLFMHFAWIFHHLVNPIIYFCFNKQLRQVLKDTLRKYGLLKKPSVLTVVSAISRTECTAN